MRRLVRCGTPLVPALLLLLLGMRVREPRHRPCCSFGGHRLASIVFQAEMGCTSGAAPCVDMLATRCYTAVVNIDGSEPWAAGNEPAFGSSTLRHQLQAFSTDVIEGSMRPVAQGFGLRLQRRYPQIVMDSFSSTSLPLLSGSSRPWLSHQNPGGRQREGCP